MAKGDLKKKEKKKRLCLESAKGWEPMLLPTRSCEFMCGHFLNYQQWVILSLNKTLNNISSVGGIYMRLFMLKRTDFIWRNLEKRNTEAIPLQLYRGMHTLGFACELVLHVCARSPKNIMFKLICEISLFILLWIVFFRKFHKIW